MKRTISWVLALVLVLSLFAGCGAKTDNAAEPTNAPDAAPTEAVAAADENLENAIAYLKAFYKEVKDGDLTPSDFERLGTVRVGGAAYEVVYTVDCAETDVKVVKGGNGMVTIDVNEDSDAEVPYVLTATITGTDGKSASLSWKHVLPVSMAGRSTDIVDEAYALESGEALSYEATLTGEIISVDTPYSADYKNITVTIKIAGREDKPIMCYRLKGEGADALMPGDIITVTGTLKNYKGTIEFDTGCSLDKVAHGENSVVALTDPDEILKAAFALDYGEYLPYPVTLTGRIVGIGKYSQQYNNITVTMKTGDGYLVKCYRVKGEGADKIWLDDEITVTGNIMNYNGTIEFDSGSQIVSWVDNPRPTAPSDPAKIVEDAYNLGNYSSLPYYCTLTGEVTKIVTPWNSSNRYITVNMTVEGKTIQTYKMTGNGIDAIKVGDTITVWGMLKNYRGTIEFDSGCKLISDDDETVDDLYELEIGESLEGETSLTGTITSIDTAYSSTYDNITVTMVVNDNGKKPVQCYRLAGSGVDKIQVGDVITVRGNLKNYNGKYEFDAGCQLQSWSNRNMAPVTVYNTPAEIMEGAKQLGTADVLHQFVLTGVVTSVDSAYDSYYGNICVTMNVEGTPLYCYRMKGTGADLIGVGDTISVSGDIVNYKGSIQFAQGCKLIKYTLTDKTDVPEVPEEPATPSTPAEIVDAAYALEAGQSLSGTYTLTGVISAVNTAYSSSYKNVTVTIQVAGREDKPIMCYRLSGTGADLIDVGDTITVSGTLINYNGTVEFASGCTLKAYTLAGGAEEPEKPTTPAEIVAAAYALEPGQSLSGSYTLTGVITSVDTEYSEQYKNVTVTIQVEGKPIVCFRLKGTGADTIAVGDTITVTGTLMNYNGTIEFNSGCTLS